MSSIAEVTEARNSKKWTDKKQSALCLFATMSGWINDHPSMKAFYLSRMLRLRDCGNELHQITCKECGNTVAWRSWQCRDRLCPICQWRKSVRRMSEMNAAHAQILEEKGYIRVAMLTLTVKNCSGESLDATMKNILRAWSLLTKRREWQRYVNGYARSVEVTRKGKGFHPHIHALLYFDKSYNKNLSTRDFVRMWRDSLGVDYDPVCDIRFVYSKREEKDATARDLRAVTAEATKYAMKAELLTSATPEEIVTIDRAIAGKRLVSYGGSIAAARRALGYKDDTDDEQEPDLACKVCGSTELVDITFEWACSMYRLADEIKV